MQDTWRTPPTPMTEKPPPPPIKPQQRISVYWTDLREWFTGTYRRSRVEPSDDGGYQRASCVVYDAAGIWSQCKEKDLTYWHCLDDELWRHEDDAQGE